MKHRTPPATAVIPTLDPDTSHLSWSLRRLAEQDHPIKEAIIVDASTPPVHAEVDGLPTRTIRFDGSRGEARSRGVREARTPYIVEMGEDAVFLNDDYVSSAIDRIETRPGVAAAGGVPIALRGNREGQMIAALERMNPSSLSTHYLVYPRSYYENNVGEVRPQLPEGGEDIPIRKRLEGFGRIERMYGQAVMKDLPTENQEWGRNALVAALVGGVISGIGSNIASRVMKRVGSQLEQTLEETA